MPFNISGYRNGFLRVFIILLLAFYISTSPLHSQIHINEILASNASVHADPDYGNFTDWIELYNPTGTAVDLSGYYLTDDPADPTMWQFQPGTEIAAGEYMLVYADGNGNGMHTNFRLAKEGESVLLVNPQHSVIDSITFPYQLNDISFGRETADRQISGFFEYPTPGAANGNQSVPGISPEPQFSQQGGFYPGSITLEISTSNPQAEIYFTLNGKEPSKSTSRYFSPIQIAQNSVVRVISYQDDMLPHPVVTHSYFINELQNLPVISLVTDPNNLFDDYYGIYVKGSAGIPGNCTSVPHNLNQNWERPTNIELFEKDGTTGLNQLAGVKIFGGCSRVRYPQKSLALYARKEYETSSFKYQLFPDKSSEDYESFVLRASGDDQPQTLFRDALGQMVVRDVIDVDIQAYRPAVVYINGQYWGIHNLREKIVEHYPQDNFGVNTDSVEMLKHNPEVPGNVVHGNPDHYNAMIDYLKSNDITLDSHYEYMKSQMDMDEYMNYMIVQIFYGARDWPSGNIKFWRSKEPPYNKWRWVLYDLDHVFEDYTFNTLDVATDPNCNCGFPNPPWSTYLLRTLLKNDSFRQEFIQRFSIYTSTHFSKARLNVFINDMQAVLAPEVPRHIVRWGGQRVNLPDNTWMASNFNSMEAWENNVQVMRDFANLRQEIAMNQLMDHFGIQSLASVRTNVEPPGVGMIKIGDTYVDAQHTDLAFENGSVLNMTFSASNGYKLSHWHINQDVTVIDSWISKGDLWKYFVSQNTPDVNWTTVAYDDSQWDSGNAQLGYGDGDETTVVGYGGDSGDKFITTWFRKKFIIDDLNLYSGCTINLLRDDGAIVYLNGQEIIRDNMPGGQVNSNTVSVTSIGGADESTYNTFTVDTDLLRNGENVIAVEIHQSYAGSSDISFDLELVAQVFSGEAGQNIYEDSLELVLNDSIVVTAVVIPSTNLEQKLYINELMASNSGVISDEAGEYEDWIELYNASNETIDIAGLFFTDSLPDPHKYQLPGGSPLTRIPPRDFLVLWADNEPEEGILHLGFKLDRQEEQIGISQIGSGMIDSLSYTFEFSGASLGRLPDASGNLQYLSASPGASNHITLLENLYINEYMAINSSAATDEYGEYDDWIEVYNDNDYPMDIGGLFITDSLDHPTKHRIPLGQPDSTTIPPYGYIVLWADNQEDQGILHLDFKLSGNGEQIGLVQAHGTGYIDSLSYGEMFTDLPAGHLPDASGNIQNLTASPGATNHIVLLEKLHINEYMSSNSSAVADEYGEYDDWIEVYNGNDYPVDVGGMFITDSLNFPKKHRIPLGQPDSTTIPPFGYLVLWADGQEDQGILHLDFKLSGNGEQIGLVQPHGTGYIDSLSYSEMFTDLSSGHLPDGSGNIQYVTASPGATNHVILLENLFINEYMASNSSTAADEYGEYDDWIEIYNGNDYPVDIGGMFITDSLDFPFKHRIPSRHADSTTVPPFGHLVLWADGQEDQGILHLGLKLKSTGEQIGILQPNGFTFIDSISYEEMYTGTAFGRLEDGTNNLQIVTASPGMPNYITPTERLFISEFVATGNVDTLVMADESRDWIEIYNDNDFDVDVGGLYITDSLGHRSKFKIPSNHPDSTTIHAKGYMVLWADGQPGQGVRHLGFKLRGRGEQLVLVAMDGQEIIDSVSYPNQYKNFSYSRLNNTGSWRFFPPTQLAYNEPGQITGIIINEIMSSNFSIADDSGAYEDWIELYNSNDYPVDIGGLYLSDSMMDCTKNRIPSHSPELTTIPPGEYLVLQADNQRELGALHLNFRLSRDGEFLQIVHYNESTIIDSITYSKQYKNSSSSRISGSDDWIAIPPTPGSPNTIPDLSGLIINEVMGYNKTIFGDEHNEYDDWIELYNSADIPIDIGGLFITDSIANPTRDRISSAYPDSTTIPPRSYFILWADNAEDQGVSHLDFKISKTGETIGLFDYQEELIDSMTYPFISPNLSWGRASDGNPTWKRFFAPTPLRSNLSTMVKEVISNPSSFKVYPNPVSDRAFLEIPLEEPGKVVIEIIEGMGKVVSKWNVYHTGSGAEIFVWDLEDALGHKVTSGLYFCRIQSGNGVSVSKILVQTRNRY